MKIVTFVFFSALFLAQNFNVFASPSDKLHGKMIFSVQVNHQDKPLENVNVQVFHNGRVIAENKTNALGNTRLELANYMHELVSIRVSYTGYISREVQGISLSNARVYPINLVKGEGLEIINGEKELEKIQDKSIAKKTELQEIKKDVNIKESQMQDKAKQSAQVVEDQNKASQSQVNTEDNKKVKKEKKQRKKKEKKQKKEAAKAAQPK